MSKPMPEQIITTTTATVRLYGGEELGQFIAISDSTGGNEYIQVVPMKDAVSFVIEVVGMKLDYCDQVLK